MGKGNGEGGVGQEGSGEATGAHTLSHLRFEIGESYQG